MSRNVRKNKQWLFAVCALLAGGVFLSGWQQLHAQGVPTADPAAAGAVPAAATAGEPTVPFGALAAVGIKRIDIKNWDGVVTGFLRFKYKTLDGRIVSVHLPAMYKTQTMTRSAWDTLLQCYGMDLEAQMTLKEDSMYAIAGEAVSKMLEQIKSEAPEEGASNPAASAMDYAINSMPSVAASGNVLPPLLPF